MVMITSGREKKPQGVVSVTRGGGFAAAEVADVAQLSGSA
jgi:hypothetical protein